MKEEWRDIKGYEGKYQISNLGRVKSLRNTRGSYREKILRFKLEVSGYFKVSLCKNNKIKSFYIHRLVAEAFIPNLNGYSQVNHKDENKTNNCVDNLEWCTAKYNSNYGTRTQRGSESSKGISRNKGSKHPQARKVQCITTGKKFNCIKEASEYYYIDRHSISDCCNGKYKYSGKHPVTGEKLVWRYIND